MHYTVDYSRDIDDTRALADAREWLSPRQLDALTDLMRDPDVTLDQFTLYCDFAGLRGRPVVALYNSLKAR